MSIITDIFSGTTGGVVNSIANVVDKFVTTKEEKLQAELELKKAENQFQIEMKTLSLEEKKAMYGDTDSARSREKEIAVSKDAPWYVKIVNPVLALGTVVLTFALFYIFIFKQDMFYIIDAKGQIKVDNTGNVIIDQNKKDIFIYILGVLSSVVTTIFGYYFGSSQGSADKSNTIKDLHSKMAS